MDVVIPHSITLNSSNIAVDSDGETEYASGTSYAIGDRVLLTKESDGTTERTPHEIYESLTASNSGNYPPDNPTDWLLVGKTNRWKMFDEFVSSQSENTGTIEVELAVSRAGKLVMTGLVASSVRIVVEANSQTISDETISLLDDGISDWYEYFFADIEYQDVVIYDLSALYLNATVTVTIDNGTNTAKCGNFIVGTDYYLGDAKFGAGVGIRDYSVKETNDFGETTLLQRGYSDRMDVNLYMLSGMTQKVKQLLTTVRATSVMWLVSDDIYIFGFVKDFWAVYENHHNSTCRLEIEGTL